MSDFTTHITLLERLAGGADPSAWHEFQDRYGLLIRGMARRQGLQEADCDEVVQDVLTSLAQAMPGFKYDPARGKFRAYLKTTTLRKIYARRRHSLEVNLSAADQIEQAVADPKIEAMWEMEWRQYHLRQALRTVEAEFNATDRAAFEAYAIRGESVAATANMMGISTDQVYQAKSRIVRRLERIIERQVCDEG